MAKKRKNSTALFEVISAGRVDRKPVAAALKTPRWWFKGQSGTAAAADQPASPVPIQSDPADPTANVTAETLYRARGRMTPTAAASAAPTSPAPIQEKPEPSPPANSAAAAANLKDVGGGAAPPASAAANSTSTALVPASAASSHAAAASSSAGPSAGIGGARPASPGVLGRSKLRFDEDSQEVTVRMRYTTAIVTAFAVLVVVGAAYVIGRHLAEGPAQANASERQQSTAQVRRGPSQPGVMDLSRGAGNGAQARLDTNSRSRTDPAARNGSSGAAPPAASPPAAPATTVYADAHIGADGTAQRISNLNYVMIINLPTDRRQRAYEVRDLMTANGILCTVEKVSKQRGSPRIPANDGWYAVVGVRGFSPGYGQLPEYRAYKNAIAAAAARFPGKAKFDKIDPMDFKWME